MEQLRDHNNPCAHHNLNKSASHMVNKGAFAKHQAPFHASYTGRENLTVAFVDDRACVAVNVNATFDLQDRGNAHTVNEI